MRRPINKLIFCVRTKNEKTQIGCKTLNADFFWVGFTKSQPPKKIENSEEKKLFLKTHMSLSSDDKWPN